MEKLKKRLGPIQLKYRQIRAESIDTNYQKLALRECQSVSELADRTFFDRMPTIDSSLVLLVLLAH
ncbi:hypothetical protein CDA63_02640 [Hymenobacter amundsenii]|uniref:Uncharacterized protein n=1 Tax=Hymenobacter amundsenii TaxID=2006685 RepID=A0A246FPJ2_9BACT|nr:hypothetical protein CDA63_02640 [Hymenobacter amundsenii]